MAIERMVTLLDFTTGDVRQLTQDEARERSLMQDSRVLGIDPEAAAHNDVIYLLFSASDPDMVDRHLAKVWEKLSDDDRERFTEAAKLILNLGKEQ
jgi:hypothetical protein